MELNRPFAPDPRLRAYAYPVIPNSTIKKFLNLFSPSIDRWIPPNTESYNVMNTFRHSFTLQNLERLVDRPNEQEFINVLETNPLYAPSNGGMPFPGFTPIYLFYGWLRGNMYEGPPPSLRGDYDPDTFDENVEYILGSSRFQLVKEAYNLMSAFIEDYENQTKEQFIRLSRVVFAIPVGNDWA